MNPKGRYTIHSSHKAIPEEKDIMTYISFDPGEDTFDIRVETRLRGDKHCSSISTVAQGKHPINYTRVTSESSKGTCSASDDIHAASKSTCSTSKGTCSVVVSSVIAILDSYMSWIPTPDVALIERQMEVNTNMMILQTIIATYFILRHPAMFVVDISPKLKGDNLGAPAKMTRPKLKAWGIIKAEHLATLRGDNVFLKYISDQRVGKKKSEYKIDDDTDNYIQVEAFCVEVGYQTTRAVCKVEVSAASPLRLVPTSSTVKKPVKRKSTKVVDIHVDNPPPAVVLNEESSESYECEYESD